MDRSKPIGNSEGTDDRGRLHVKVSNKLTEPVPVFLTDIGPESGTEIHQYTAAASSPGTEITVSTHIVPPSKTWELSQVDLLCRTEGVGYIKVNGTPIASFRTGAARPRDSQSFNPRKILAAGDIITVTFKARTGSPITDVESLFQTLES